MTRDGIPLLMHDSSVKRTTTGVGYVSNLSRADLSRVSACPERPNRCRVPTLTEALSVRGDDVSFLLAHFPARLAPEWSVRSPRPVWWNGRGF